MNHEVITGDALQVLPTIADGSIDLTVTSPPYDNLRYYHGFTFCYQSIARELFRVTKEGGVVVWIVGDATFNGSETGTSFRQALFFRDNCGFNLHDTMIYEKDGCPYPESNRYYPTFEYMFVLSKGKPCTVNLIQDQVNKYAGEKKARANNLRQRDGSIAENSAWRIDPTRVVKPHGVRGNVWRYPTGRNKTTCDGYAFTHPAMFPEQLALDHILSWSNEGDTVLDPMCGSGTTGKMAVIAKRNFIGIDISAEYCKIARARISRAKGIPCDIPRLNKSEKVLPLFHLESNEIEQHSAKDI